LSRANTPSTSTREYVESRLDEIGRSKKTDQIVQLHGVTFKKRAPRAIKEIKKFATKSMVRWTHSRKQMGNSRRREKLTIPFQGTSDVRLDPQLNKKVWEAGIKGVPYRLRIRISRKRNDEENAKERLYSYVQAVNVKDAKGLQTALVEDA
jgi:large subunit ribosomal protein L31e